jgi:hypothetical protein
MKAMIAVSMVAQTQLKNLIRAQYKLRRMRQMRHIIGLNEDISSDQNPNNNENISLEFPGSCKYYNKPSNLTGLDGEKSASVKPPPITTSVACVACVAEAKDQAEDEAAVKLRNKIKEVGLPAIPCIFCGFSDPIEFDLVLHHLECHKPEPFKLPIGKGLIYGRKLLIGFMVSSATTPELETRLFDVFTPRFVAASLNKRRCCRYLHFVYLI